MTNITEILSKKSNFGAWSPGKKKNIFINLHKILF